MMYCILLVGVVLWSAQSASQYLDFFHLSLAYGTSTETMQRDFIHKDTMLADHVHVNYFVTRTPYFCSLPQDCQDQRF